MRFEGNIKANCQNWVLDAAYAQSKVLPGKQLLIQMGLVDKRLGKWIRAGEQFIYIDHAYFNRGWANYMFRAIRNGCHLTRVLKRPDDRLKKFNVQIEPWRKTGRRVVIIPPSPYYEDYYGLKGWTDRTFGELKRYTQRPIDIKREKGNLRQYLADAWAVVCSISVAGVEAALMGVPVFATEHCASWPVNAGPLAKIDAPEYPERHAWACSLAYASWHKDEITRVRWLDYDYSLRDDLP